MTALLPGGPAEPRVTSFGGLRVRRRREGHRGPALEPGRHPEVNIGSLVVFGRLALLVAWLRAWTAIGSSFADHFLTTLTVAMPAALALLVAVAVAVAAFAGIRRVVP